MGGMGSMFRNATAFNQDLSSWDVGNVVSFNFMFMGASSFDSDLSNWDVGGATQMRYMFSSASSFSSDLATWDISNVTDMEAMLSSSGMTTSHYSSTLTGWSEGDTPDDVKLGAHGLLYDDSASTARDALIDDHGWTIEGDSEQS